MAIATVNPASGETVKTYDEMSEADLERALAAAAAAAASYRLTGFDDRAEWMRRAAGILDGEQDQIAAMMTTEMGKTLAAARQEVAKCATACRYYADHGADCLVARAGFPEGTFQTLLIGSAKVASILRDRRVVAATLTGSGPAGQAVAAVAGSEIKKVVLELGGSDPFVVMPSADLRAAAQVAAVARLLNNGQSCIAAKRFIVHEAVYAEFERLFTEQMAAKVVGDPMLEGTDVGPLASEQQRDDVEKLVADAVAKGAKALCGGAAPQGPGFYYPPTVLAGITPDMRVHTEEVFGPVATLYRAVEIDAAIEIANGTEFGLGANAWTTDEAERDRLIRDLVAGLVSIHGN